MTTVELFAGIGGFRLACNAKSITTIFANDIKSSACRVYMDQFGNEELLAGDINKNISKIPEHDLLTAGFPCQPFSSAGKKQGIRDFRGTFFESIISVLMKHNPQYFVLENVKRLLSMEQGEHFATILDRLSSLGYFIEWRILNAMHHGLAQNRQRIFITGIRVDEMPDRVRLINQQELNNLPTGAIFQIGNYQTWLPITHHAKSFSNWGLAYNGLFCGFSIPMLSNQLPMVILKDIIQTHVSEEFDFTNATISRLDENTMVNRFVQGVEIISNQSGGARMGYTIFGVNGVAPTLTASSSRHYERYQIGEQYRRLTNIEYARIQGFSDHHCRSVPIHVQYELIGNAVPPSMVSWVLDRLLSQGTPIFQPHNQKQMEIF